MLLPGLLQLLHSLLPTDSVCSCVDLLGFRAPSETVGRGDIEPNADGSYVAFEDSEMVVTAAPIRVSWLLLPAQPSLRSACAGIIC